MILSMLQLLTIYLFAALPCFVAWIANGNKKEDIWMPMIGSLLLAAILSVVFLFA